MPEPELKLVKASDRRSLEDLADDDLMELLRLDRQDAFETLIRRHQHMVLGFSIRYFGDRNLGREVSQDVFLSLWAERRRYKARGKFKNFLLTISRNRCHLVARQRKNRIRKHANLAHEQLARPKTDDSLPLDALVEAERARQVREKMTCLPDGMRQVLILRYTHEMSIEEIAASTNLPPGTVKSHVFRGLKRLGRLLTGENR